MQLSWIGRLYDSNFHPWKVIPTNLFSYPLFYPNRNTDFFAHVKAPLFYKNIVFFWSQVAASLPVTASSILSECIYNNNLLKIDNNIVKFNFLSSSKLLFVADLFDEEGNTKSWDCFKRTNHLKQSEYFKWVQLINIIPENWKKIIKQDKGISRLFCEFKPHLITKAKMYPLVKLSSKEFYKILVSSLLKSPTSQGRIMEILNMVSLPWKEIYSLPRQVTIDTYSRIFQYKCLNNILYLNNALFKMKLVDSPLCSFCKEQNESISHFFYDCRDTKSLWNSVQFFFENKLTLPNLTLQCAYLGFYEVSKNDYNLFNTILLTFKITLYQQRDKQKINILKIVNDIRKREVIEREIYFHNIIKKQIHVKKWERIQPLLIE